MDAAGIINIDLLRDAMYKASSEAWQPIVNYTLTGCWDGLNSKLQKIKISGLIDKN